MFSVGFCIFIFLLRSVRVGKSAQRCCFYLRKIKQPQPTFCIFLPKHFVACQMWQLVGAGFCKFRPIHEPAFVRIGRWQRATSTYFLEQESNQQTGQKIVQEEIVQEPTDLEFTRCVEIGEINPP